MQVSKVLRMSTIGYSFFCPGCQQPHIVQTHGDKAGPRWTYSGTPESPTFSPSIDCKSAGTPGHEDREFTKEEEAEYDALFEANKHNHDALTSAIAQSKFFHHCHSFVRDGMIQFLDDCTHKLKGQTVPLPELPERMQDPNYRDA